MMMTKNMFSSSYSYCFKNRRLLLIGGGDEGLKGVKDKDVVVDPHDESQLLRLRWLFLLKSRDKNNKTTNIRVEDDERIRLTLTPTRSPSWKRPWVILWSVFLIQILGLLDHFLINPTFFPVIIMNFDPNLIYTDPRAELIQGPGLYGDQNLMGSWRPELLFFKLGANLARVPKLPQRARMYSTLSDPGSILRGSWTHIDPYSYESGLRRATCFSRNRTRISLGVPQLIRRKTTTNNSSVPPTGYHPLIEYLRSLKWTPIPLSVGFALLAYQHYRRVTRQVKNGRRTTHEEFISRDWEIKFYRMIPWRGLSRLWGWVNSLNLPGWARGPVLASYARAFGCDLSEAEIEDLRTYKNLGEFFKRRLKTGLRPVDQLCPLVSPADGTVLHYGKVECGRIEQVKGVSYSLPAFLGPPTWTEKQRPHVTTVVKSGPPRLSSESLCSTILKSGTDTELFYCVIYLAPGDYHRFHSPADWQINFRRHFAGELLSVNPFVANWIGGLFSLNERAVYIGSWKHGFFSMTAVGATNVGSIRVYEDPELMTNSRRLKKNTQEDKWFDQPIMAKRGEDIGEFNLGSTIVLLFEAPLNFEFNLNCGEPVRVGRGMSQLLGPMEDKVKVDEDEDPRFQH